MKTYLAEILGTFLLVFIGTASVVTGGFGTALPIGQEGIGLAFGIGVIAAAYAVGPISGAHLNPAVTLGVFLAGRLPAKDVIPYWIAQIIGGILASLALWIMVSGQAGGHTTGFAANGWDPNAYSAWSAFITEIIATFVFVTVILGVTSASHTTVLAGLVIGLTLAAIHFAVIPVTGTSVNPARSIGPALFTGTAAIAQLWLFIVAPLIGGAIAGVVAKSRVFEKD
ncbi:MIP family channel protein [Mesorhizobium sp. BAC0120]|uniref:MIP family channel protein n=1 Tax=Mesorhizobium sp. BAC0120 TaxID=3090670 RepID=UPI00298CA871|nr:MIP family channel protein [Mesorhizobium sp. BAC0120]MDW6024716.1 MIP family channel protein [Mesorhizobium sp. BAC0120]